MSQSELAPDFRTRDQVLGCLRALRSKLETEGVRHAALFGSVARGDDVPDSDVDIILDLDPDQHIGLFAFERIRDFLEAELRRRVDLGSMRSLRPGRHDEIIAELVEAF